MHASKKWGRSCLLACLDRECVLRTHIIVPEMQLVVLSPTRNGREKRRRAHGEGFVRKFACACVHRLRRGSSDEIRETSSPPMKKFL